MLLRMGVVPIRHIGAEQRQHERDKGDELYFR
jgi:hypothetical protein